jgi:transcriptional regulator of aromatic amino acid metabolism
LVTNKLTGDAVEYPSKRQAAKELKVSDVTINNYLRSGKLLKDI